MIIGLLKEPSPETRVSLLPEHVAILKKWNADLLIETGAGEKAFASDIKYSEAGATIATREVVLETADIILSINPPGLPDIGHCKAKILFGLFQPLYNASMIKEWADKGFSIFSIDMLPRTTRAQSMDVLSSQANIAGYKAVLLAANLFPKYFPMFMTAAGSVPPAKMLILGAGVAGLAGYCHIKKVRSCCGSI